MRYQGSEQRSRRCRREAAASNTVLGIYVRVATQRTPDAANDAGSGAREPMCSRWARAARTSRCGPRATVMRARRPHRRDSSRWTGPASEVDDDLVRMADAARRALTHEEHAADLQRIIDREYLRADTPQGGSGFSGTIEEWTANHAHIVEAVERGRHVPRRRLRQRLPHGVHGRVVRR